MCDYSLHLVQSRPAKVGDNLVSTAFANSLTRGFAAVDAPDVAVCLLPGTEVAFEQEAEYHRGLSFLPRYKQAASGNSTRISRTCITMPWNSRTGRSYSSTTCVEVSARPFCRCRRLHAP
jgi:hypothetical protein